MLSLSSAHDHRIPFLRCEILIFYFPGDHYSDEYLHSQYSRFLQPLLAVHGLLLPVSHSLLVVHHALRHPAPLVEHSFRTCVPIVYKFCNGSLGSFV